MEAHPGLALRQETLIVAFRSILLGIVLSFAAAPAWAQPAPAPPVEVPEPEGEGLSGSVTDESAWQDLGIAIPSFATNRETSTPANAPPAAALRRRRSVRPSRPRCNRRLIGS